MKIDAKVNRVIAGCKTKEQIICATKFVILAERKTRGVLRATYWKGVIDGICHVKGWK